MPSVILLKQSA